MLTTSVKNSTPAVSAANRTIITSIMNTHQIRIKILCLLGMAIDIHSKGKWPSNSLSNFYPHEFIFEGIKCGSMEGFLQSLKTDSTDCQQLVCSLTGKDAKLRSTDTWKKEQNVFWKGHRINRHGNQFQLLIRRAYREMLKQNPDFKEALCATGTKRLFHSIGNPNPMDTILTEKELCDILMELRHEIHNDKKLLST